ncbi:DUF805 domain-containing protein [Streptomyces sp. B6B3]|uniref:DUF805 domain-containing protein n=1 Tax=Streptomyces sp. B6B3 TaxID=3153570 RepID=UPI00325D5A00
MIGMKEAVQRGLLRSFVWRGRASRAEYWWFVLFMMLCSWGADASAAVSDTTPLVPLLAGVFCLALGIPFVAVSVRRVHDIDRNGAWALVTLLPLVGLVFLCKRGDPMPNRYGPPPTSDLLVSTSQ